MTVYEPLQFFLDALADGTATPGGGGAAAAAGAMGAALVCMVCNLTIGRRRFADIEGEMRAIVTRAETLRAELTQLVNDDAAAYAAVMDAYRLPKATDAEQMARHDAVQAATKGATLTPLATARACGDVIELARSAADRGNPNAASDAAAAAACAQAGLKAAALNVTVNLSSIEDGEFAANCRAELDAILSKQRLANAVIEQVRKGLA